MNYKFSYRPELDGLRAIAVLSIIIYHSQINILGYQFLSGGFVGVDIFFVISGYLITSIILRELTITGKFSLKYFYERRIRRIIPVLLLVMSISLLFAWLYLIPSSLINFSKSILYSLAFTTNIFFHYSGQEYGADIGKLIPFLHTWSLSVEEQFYILFPIIVLIFLKFFKRYLIHIFFLGFVISLGLADWGSREYPSATFYFLHTRLWEFLAGSIIAYFETTRGYRSKKKLFNYIFPSIGLILIAYSILFFNDKMFHPSFYTLSPIIGVCLIIWFSHLNDLTTNILSSKLFVGIGLISYSLYLWHYPAFVFARVYFIDKGLYSKIFTGSTILILSIISYFVVEKPARDKRYNFKKIFYPIVLIYIIIIYFNYSFIKNKGFEERFFTSNSYYLSKIQYAFENKNFEINFNYNDYDNRKNVLIVGNSHGENLLEIFTKTNLSNQIYFNLVSPIIRKNDYNFQVSYLYEFLVKNRAIIDYYDGDFNHHLKKQYNKAELILISSNYSNEDLFILDDLFKLLKKDNKKIIIFNQALIQDNNNLLNLSRLDNYVYKNKELPDENNLKKIEYDMYLDLKNIKDLNTRINVIAKNNRIPIIEREKIFCNFEKKSCPAMTLNGFKIYWDRQHITSEGAIFFARKIEKDKFFLEYLNSALNLSLN